MDIYNKKPEKRCKKVETWFMISKFAIFMSLGIIMKARLKRLF